MNLNSHDPWGSNFRFVSNELKSALRSLDDRTCSVTRGRSSCWRPEDGLGGVAAKLAFPQFVMGMLFVVGIAFQGLLPVSQGAPIVQSIPTLPSQDDELDLAFINAQLQYDSNIRPLLQNACFDCHGNATGEGEIDLSQFSSVQQIIDSRGQWKAILHAVRSRQMPPPDAVDFSAIDREMLERFIETLLYDLDCQNQSSPGVVTIRRLNRIEYQNTVRDFLAVPFNATEHFPADEVGYGFDNIGDVLSVSPIHLEKYLDAAEQISRRAIFDPDQVKRNVRWRGDELEGSQRTHTNGADQVITTNDTISIRHHFHQTGTYEFSILASEDPAGDEHAMMGLMVDGVELDEFTVRAQLRRPRHHRTESEITEGVHTIQITFKNDFYNPEHPEPQLRDRNLIVRSLAVVGPTDFDSIGLPRYTTSLKQLLETHEIPQNIESVGPELTEYVRRLASFSFRRPATDVEVARLVELFALNQVEQPNVYASMQVVLQALLVSPHFLYRIEQPVEPGSIRDLNAFELATALSYFLWSSMPDDDLINLAARDELAQPEVLADQVRRMLADPKSTSLIDNFATQWLQLRLLEDFDPDPELFGEFDELLKQSMIRETKLLFEETVRQDLPVAHLLNSPTSFINRRLAIHYGLAESDMASLTNEEFVSHDLTAYGRRGILGQASFLTLTSNPTRTSPVKRGKWVLENLLAQPPPPPMPDVPALDNQAELTGTLRQRMVQHSADPSCAICHDQLDPIGFSLEKFDAIGRYREFDEGQAIDDAGVMPDGTTISGPLELQRILSSEKRGDFLRCLTEKLAIYALGRGLEDYDDCMVKQIADTALDGKDRFSDIVLAIVMSNAFQKRGYNKNLKIKE